MCGRYFIPAEFERFYYDFQTMLPLEEGLLKGIEPNYDLSPSQTAPVIVQQDANLVLMNAHWGLIPSWAKDPKIGFKTFNARAETLAQKPSFRSAFQKRRCLVPAGGFYEWQGEKGHKTRYCIRPLKHPLFLFAGLWEHWTQADGQQLYSFTIITTSANEAMHQIHERMPVILEPDQARAWLDSSARAADLTPLMRPCAAGALELYPVQPQPHDYHGPDLTLRLE